MTEDRAEHLAWCKQRALAYVDREQLAYALASFTSDMQKHPDTEAQLMTSAAAVLLQFEAVPAVADGDPARLRRYIEGFN